MNKVVLATGNKKLNDIVRSTLETTFMVANLEVSHMKYIEEVLETEEPGVIVFNDYYLTSDTEEQQDKDNQWLDLIDAIRESYEERLRIVFLCEREDDDPFLMELIQRHVFDIFNGQALDKNTIHLQLSNKPSYKNIVAIKKSVERSHLTFDRQFKKLKEETIEQEIKKLRDEYEEKHQKALKTLEPMEDISSPYDKKEKKRHKVKPQKKVINKQVIKRNLKVEVTNHTEKVVGVPLQRKIILTISPFKKTGCTFFSHLLAKELSRYGVKISYIENPFAKGYTYDRFNGHTNHPDYKSIFDNHVNEKESDESFVPLNPESTAWLYQNIYLHIKGREEPVYSEADLDFQFFIKTLLSLRDSTYIIIDVGADFMKETFRELFDIADLCYVLLPYDLSDLQYIIESENEDISYLHRLFQEEKTHLVGNRFTEKIMKHPIMKELFSAHTPLYPLPSFDDDLIFSMQYNGDFLYRESNSKPDLSCMVPFINELLPKDFLYKYGKKKGVLSKLFRKRISISST